jgi:hypothetical protein
MILRFFRFYARVTDRGPNKGYLFARMRIRAIC